MLVVIANPIAGSGAGKTTLERVRELLRERGVDFHCEQTQRAEHAIQLARMAANAGVSGIVCVGGDGTLFEIVNGLAGRKTTLYLAPCGTGNDFARMLHLPDDPIEALKAQLDGVPYDADVGKANNSYFINVSGCGFDVEVLRQATRFKKLGKGLLPYFLGILAALRRFHPLDVELTMNGVTERRSVTILSVGNGRYFGGGMMPVPHAEIDDGLFDVVVVDRVNRLVILRLLSKFISGKHTDLPIAHELRCQALTIRCKGMTINMDGELRDMDEVSYALLPGAITLMRPA